MRVLCWLVQRELSALWDRELEGWKRRCVELHLARCVACRQAATQLAEAIRFQTEVLRSEEADLSQAVRSHLHAVLDKLEAEPSDDGSRGTRAFWFEPRAKWAAVGAALAALLLAVGASSGVFQKLESALIAFGIASPPPEVVEAPDFFRDYPLLENLDWLENWERVSQGSSDPNPSENGRT